MKKVVPDDIAPLNQALDRSFPKLPFVSGLDSSSFECRKVIGLRLLQYVIGLKDSRHFFIQSEVKPKPIVSLLPALCVSYM